MWLIRKLRNFDQFGAKVNFTIGGDSYFRTIGGGIISFFLQLGIMAFFC